MEDASTDNSSDELCASYTTYAKRTYKVALKRAAEAEVITNTTALSDDSSDSEKLKPVERKILKRKSKQEPQSNSRTTRAKRRNLDSLQSKEKGVENCVVLSSDEETLKDSFEENCDSSITPKFCVTRRNENIIEDELYYDTEPEVENAKEMVTLSDSSDIEEISSPNIHKNKVIKDNNELMSIKVCWRFQPIQKFQLRRHQKFKTLLEHFAKLERVSIEQVVIHGGKDSWRSIEPYDTPDSIGVTIADVLEGGILSNGNVKHSGLSKRYRDPSDVDGEEIELKVQQEQTRSFPLLVKRHQKMKVLFIKVAEQLEVDISKVKLFVDGEAINPEETPNNLELDNGDVLDVVTS